MSIEFRCDQCGKHYAAAASVAGKAIQCKQCGGTIRIPTLPAREAPVTPPPPAPAMSIEFRCDQCGKHYAAPESVAGKAITCKQCGAAIRVPGTPVPAVAGVAARAEEPGPAPPPPPALDVYGLDEEEPAATAAGDGPSIDGDDAPAPALTRAGAAPKPRSKAERKTWEKRVKEKDRQRGSYATGGVFGVSLGGMAAVAWFVFRIWLRVHRLSHHAAHDEPGRPDPADNQVVAAAEADEGSPVPPVAAAPSPAGPMTLPDFPDLGPGAEIEPGVVFHEVAMQPRGNRPGHAMKVWLYLPAGEHDPASLPCVLTAGAGSTLLTGMNLSDGDRAEHLPYVRAGFAVLAYELDGYVPRDEQRSEPAMAQGIRRFLAARAGLVNAHIALEYLVAKVPQVDLGRIYAAGHSSAGTLALLVAANEPRIRACVAYAPAIDLQKRFPPQVQQDLPRAIPGAAALFTTYSPRQNESKLNCPLFLFHAEGDTNVSVQDSRDGAARLTALGKAVTLVTVPGGDHYNSMIRDGIPRAIEWLKGLPTTRSGS